MPSAEKVTSVATKLESAPASEPKSVENTQKENAPDQNEKSVPAGTSIQQVISIISNKIRNLEKRKNKLDGYIKEEESGKELSSEQQKAVEKYDEVSQQLSLSKEFYKQFQLIGNAASKEAKREARKNLFARQIQEVTKVRDVLMIQELLQRLKEEAVRSDFLNQRNGACRVDKVEMAFIDQFAQFVVPTRPKFSNEQSFSSSAKSSADQFSFLIDGRTRQFMDTDFTYEKAKELFNRIQSCDYWEKDVKFVEVVEDNRAENDTPNTDDCESKEEKSEDGREKTLPVSAPAPAQVPTPTFNGNVNQMPVQQQQQQHQHHQRPMPRVPHQQQHQGQQQRASKGQQNAKSTVTSVTAVENAYFNNMKYSQPQGQLVNNGLPITPSQHDFGTNFSFLQDSELESPAAPGSHQKMPVNVIQTINQPKHSSVQHQQMQQQPSMTTQNFKNANFHPQSSPIAGQMYPPGLKVQHSHIPVNYQPTQPQLNQQTIAPSSQVPTNMIPKQQQQQPPVNGNQVPGYGNSSQTPPIQQQQQQQTSRTAYPTMVPKAQYQQQQQQQLPNNNSQNLQKPMEPKSAVSHKADGAGDKLKSSDGAGRNVQMHEKEKQREDYQQQPQIDTWTNETAAQSGATNTFSSRPSGGGFNRNNRAAGERASGDRAAGDRASGDRAASGGNGNGGAKYNNYRNPQQPRNYTENGSGDSPREGQAPGTFFRNNERYNGSAPTTAGGNRFENRGENRGAAGGNFKPREGNHRAGSGRFAGSASASAQGSSNPAQRK